jgi:O-antigen/teichoic acid export membrane protein
VSAVPQSVPEENAPHRKHGMSQNLSWALAAEASVLLASLLSFKIVAKQFSLAQYGKYAGIYGLIGFAVSSCTSWAGLVIPQWIVREKESAVATMRSTLTFLCLLSAVGMAAVAGLGALMIHGISVASIVSLAAAELVGGAGVLPLVMLAQSAISIRSGLWVRIAAAVAKGVFLVALKIFGSVTFVHLGLTLLFSQVTVWVLAGAFIARRLGFVSRPGQPLRHHLSTAATFMVSVGSYAVFEEGDKPTMVAFHHAEDNGQYGAAYRCARLAMVPLAAMENATHMHSVQSGTHLGEHVRRARKFTLYGLAYGVLALIGLNIFGPLMLRYLADPKFVSAMTQLRWLSPLVVLRGCRNFSDNGLLGLGKLRSRMAINLGSAVLALSLYLALIPRYSWKGALAATVITEVALVVASWTLLITYQRREDFSLKREAARRRKAMSPL